MYDTLGDSEPQIQRTTICSSWTAALNYGSQTIPLSLNLTLTPTGAPTLYLCTYSLGAGGQIICGLGGIGVEGLTSQKGGEVYGAPRCTLASICRSYTSVDCTRVLQLKGEQLSSSADVGRSHC